jgi:hypothetical protein
MTGRQQMGMLFLGVLAVMLVLFFSQRAALNEGFMDAAGRCGSNLGVCPGWPGTDSRCINGYCKSDVPPKLPAVSDLPIRPDRYTDPTPLLREKAGL